MKTTLIITAAAVAGTLLVKYLMSNKEAARQVPEPVPLKKSHHRTEVFAHAKKY